MHIKLTDEFKRDAFAFVESGIAQKNDIQRFRDRDYSAADLSAECEAPIARDPAVD